MKSIVHHASPNIVPGTHFTAARFQEMYAWIATLAADSLQAALHPLSYGLVMPYDGKAALSLERSGNQLRLTRCNGVTPQGSIVALFEDCHPPVTASLDDFNLHSNEEYFVVVEVDHKTRWAFGPESTDLPRRPLYSMPAFAMHLQSKGQDMSPQPDAFNIGLLVMELGEWKLDENYIPPCLHLGANKSLSQRYFKYQEGLAILLEVQPQIIRQTDTYQEKSMIELREFCMQLGSLLASRRHRYIHLGERSAPYEIFELWSSVAQEASFLLECFVDRPGFYNLLKENTRSVNGVFYTPQSLDESIKSLANLRFNQDNISDAIQATDKFLQMIVPIFKALGLGTLRPVGNQGAWNEVNDKKNTSPTW